MSKSNLELFEEILKDWENTLKGDLMEDWRDISNHLDDCVNIIRTEHMPLWIKEAIKEGENEKALFIVNIAKRLEDIDFDCIKVCNNCGDFMSRGFVINDGEEYYCSEDCRNGEISEEDWSKYCAYLIFEEERTEEEQQWANEYGDTGCYYTEWD